MTDWTAIRGDLAAAKRYRLVVMAACEIFVERRAAEGDEEARWLAALVDDSIRRNQTAVLDAQLALPTYHPTMRR